MDFLYKLKRLAESFDFDSNDDYELGQPIIDRYKTIQTLEDLISKFVYSHYPNNKNVVTPGVVLDSFIWRFFPSYYNSDNDFIEGLSYDVGDKCKMTIIHAGEDFERHERKRIKIEFPKKSTRKSFVVECSRKMAEGLVDAGIDMKHLVTEKSELSEAFDFNSEPDDEDIALDNTVNKLKRIALLSSRINDEVEYMKERLEEVDDSMMEGESFLDNILFHLFSFMDDPYEATDFVRESSGNGYDYTLFVPDKGHQGTSKKSSQKVHLPMMIDLNKNVSSYVRSIAKALVEIDADEVYDLFESFDFDSDLEIEGNIEAIKKEHEYRRLCINTFFDFLRERVKMAKESLLHPSPYLKRIRKEYGINTMNQFRAIFAGPLYGKILVRTKRLDQKEERMNYSLYYITSDFSFDYREVELCSFDWDRMMKPDKEHIDDFFEMFWDEIGTSENALMLGEKLVERNFMVGESFDFDNDEEYDLGIDKISTYYKILEKELDFLLDAHASSKGYNVALMLSLFLQRIGLEASEITVSNVRYPKGTIHFTYDDSERNHWKSLISGNREETKNEIRRILSDILKDEEVFYDLSEIMKENKLNESFDFNAEDNYEQEIDDKVSKIRKFQEWNFDNGFKIVENFYSVALKEDPNTKWYPYPSISLLINILYPIDKSLPQGDTREVKVIIADNQSRNNGTGLYFRNNKTGKTTYRVFPYEYTIEEFKNQWAYQVIEALEEIGASKSTFMRNQEALHEAFDFSNDSEDSLLEKISEIALVRKIVEMFKEKAEQSFKNYFGTDFKEIYTTTAYNVYLDKIKDYINTKSGQWFGIGTSWIKNTESRSAMDIRVMNSDGGEFEMRVPHKVSFEELTDVEFPRFLKAIMDNMPDYKEILMKNF